MDLPGGSEKACLKERERICLFFVGSERRLRREAADQEWNAIARGRIQKLNRMKSTRQEE